MSTVTLSPPITINVDATGKLVITTTTPPPPPVLSADFTYTPFSPQIATPVNFSGTTSGGTPPYAYAWNFGDGAMAVGASTSHAYTTAGTYVVLLTVTDAAGTIATATHSINIGAPPTALTTDFTFAPASPTVGQSVGFGGTASGGTPPYIYTWAFGDGGTGAGTSTIHTYTAAGTYNATLTVTDAAVGTATATHSVIVTVAQPPPASSKFFLHYQGFDYDGGGEEQLTLNGRHLASLPPSSNPANAQIYIPISLEITSFIVQGPNTLTFTQAPWDFSGMKNLQIVDQNGTVLFSDPTDRRLNPGTNFTYNFNIGATPPPGPLQPSLTITDIPNPSAPGQAVSITGKLALPSGAGLGSQVINLQQSLDSGVTWTQQGTTTTAADGSYAFTQTFATAGNYQLRTQFPGA